MLGLERRQKITELIQRDQKVYVPNLSTLFNVTEETIRRDLEKLEKEGILTRTYGGAVSNQHTYEDLSFTTRETMNLENKQFIAAKASELIKNNDTIMIDASTTCLECMNFFKSKKDITVITNSVKIPYDYVNSHLNIISTGGILRSHSLALVGPIAHNALTNYYVDFAIISCKGLSLDKGIMESNEPEGEFKKKMVQQANKIILLADHTKFNKIAFTRILGFEDINYIVTNQEPPSEWLDLCIKHNIQLIY